ncbi:MAG: hypothetical protein IJ217_03280 [Clostridia bacterium]|nr:hypothetical protein [Clostridia bacterium]
MNYTERNRLFDRLSAVGLMLIFVEVFLEIAKECLVGNFGMSYVMRMPTILTVIGIAFLLVGVIVLIFAYRKENGWRAGFGIEFIVLAFATIFLLHAYTDLPASIAQIKWGVIIPCAFLAYYVGKAIYVIVKANKKK